MLAVNSLSDFLFCFAAVCYRRALHREWFKGSNCKQSTQMRQMQSISSGSAATFLTQSLWRRDLSTLFNFWKCFELKMHVYLDIQKTGQINHILSPHCATLHTWNIFFQGKEGVGHATGPLILAANIPQSTCSERLFALNHRKGANVSLSHGQMRREAPLKTS